MLKRTLFFLLYLLLFGAQSFSLDIMLVNEPRFGQCFPKGPGTKKYLVVENRGLYVRKVFSCIYSCLDKNDKITDIVGTSDVTDWFSEDGRSFVCEGYRESMRWVQTPYDNKSWGYWELNGTTPFYPLEKDIPELIRWAQRN